MSKDKMLKFKLGAFTIHGILCSGNKWWNSVRPDGADSDCSVKIKANPKFDAAVMGIVKVICPKNCADQSEFKVYGTSIYHFDSAVCRAGVFSGFLDDAKGGELNI